MAATEDEGDNNKNDDPLLKPKGNYVSIMHQELANKLTKPGTPYEAKVSSILSGWDLLTGATANNSQLSFATFLKRWTLQLVLQGEWPKLAKIVKTRLGATIQRCAKDPLLKSMCNVLLPLVSDPWGHSTLKNIFASTHISDEEIVKYIKEETWDVVKMRVDTLIESKCEELALLFLRVCIRCLRMNPRPDDLLYSQEDHNHFVDVYYVLLYKHERNRFLEEVRKMDLIDGVNHVQRLLAHQEKSKIWKHRLKISELELQIFLASCIVKPYGDTFRYVFRAWCDGMQTIDLAYDKVCGMVKKYLQLSESSLHIYAMGSVLYEKFGSIHGLLVTELMIKALTLDLNALEGIKFQSKEKCEEHIHLEHQLAQGFIDLSLVFEQHPNVARECVLTAFSLHPTAERLQTIQDFLVQIKVENGCITPPEIVEKVTNINSSQSGNIKTEDLSQDDELANVENNNEVKPDLNGSLEQEINIQYPGHFNLEVKGEADSMDTFFDSTDNLIQQLKCPFKDNKEYTLAVKESPLTCDILTAPSEILDCEKLGLSRELCDDLAVVLSSPRWQKLSWLLSKEELLSICEKYLSDTESTKNVTKELKFLNIDYNQFKHMPSPVFNEFTGIEKGYEHFMNEESADGEEEEEDEDFYYSSGSDADTYKGSQGGVVRGRSGHTPGKSRYDNDYSDVNWISKNKLSSLASLSESDDSDYVPTSYTSPNKSKVFEGKRVTSISCNDDSRKRLCVDITGKIKQKNTLGNHLKIIKRKTPVGTGTVTFSVKKTNNFCTAPPIARNNFSPNLTSAKPTNYNQIPSKNQINQFLTTKDSTQVHGCMPSNMKVSDEKKVNTSFTDAVGKGWKYAGCLISDRNAAIAPKPLIIPIQSSHSNSCSYRTKEGKLITLNTNHSSNPRPSLLRSIRQPLPHVITFSKYEESYAKFIKERIPDNHLKDVKNRSLESDLKYLRKHGTSVIVKKEPGRTAMLVDAQKKVFNRILSPENSRNAINPTFQTITMPVSHNPPNLPLSDKSIPVGSLNRVLPKGTTVVRRSRTGAGPSGLNNGGSSTGPGNRPRPSLSITPSNTYLISNVSQYTTQSNTRTNATFVRTIIEPSSSSSFLNEMPSPLAVATVVGSVSTSPRLNSPGETQHGSAQIMSGITSTTTVANTPGEIRAPSMLETLLRDRASPLVGTSVGGNAALTTTTCSISEPLVVSAPIISGIPFPPVYSESPSSTPIASSHLINKSADSILTSATSSSIDSTNIRASLFGSSNLGLSVIATSLPSNVLSTSLPTGGNVIVSGITNRSSLVNSSVGGVTISNSTVGGLPQVLVPAQLIQVQGNVSSGLSIVHPGLDLRLPPGTRVLKSSSSNVRQSTPISQNSARPLNVLHKIVPNRQILRTVVVPHSVPLQNLTHQPAQLVALSQSSSGCNNNLETQVTTKISSSQLQKMLGHNIVPGSLLIRTVRPSLDIDNNTITKPPNPTTIIHHTADSQKKSEKPKECEKSKIISVIQTPDEGLAERLNRHYLKTFSAPPNSGTQSVGTQTQTTAVKPVTGQFVSQIMNQMRGGINTVATTIAVTSSIPSPSPLALASSNAVSSETLEQLREFESVFEKVSNKSVCHEKESSVPSLNVSSEESMIAAQLLSMANETPSVVVTTTSSFVYSSAENPSTSVTTLTTSSVASGGVAGSSTFITIPGHSQPGTLILVNPSASASGIVTMATSGVNTQPPPAASPALSSTSSHSSIASSPSPTASKNKITNPVTKIVLSPVTPKSPPPPPKAPPKPVVAKPQVEESDETKARIQAILEQYKLDLANTPQPQPAPRNRKNCPPPKNEGKSPGKKKSGSKKPDGGSSSSPGASDHMLSVSSSPAPSGANPSGEDSEGSIGSSQFHSQEDKIKTEESSPVLQGVMVSNIKIENSSAGVSGLTALSQGRVVQLIRHGNKVTAITSRQPYAKAGLASGGPPPNVTIQGRININELMENQLTLLTGGSSTNINQSGSALISKLLQQQQSSSSSVQQVIVQTSSVGSQGVEEVPPSPATLTKQLQNAYNMTEAALSPTISQSQMSSSSSYSQSFSESNRGGGMSPHSENHHRASLACLSSPSGDVYLDQSGLGLDSLVDGERPQSPCLSDLVPPVPLLSWSPRSPGDSIMAPSPSLNEALSSNIALHHSEEDSLCDSSTGFPAIFSSMEGDTASVFSNDDLQHQQNPRVCAGASTTSSSHLQQQNGTREQDQTVTSSGFPSSSSYAAKKEESSDWGAIISLSSESESKMFKSEDSNQRRRSQRHNTSRQQEEESSNVVHNGYEDKVKEEIEDGVKEENEDKVKSENSPRQTRGSKRRSESRVSPHEEKRRTSRRSDVEDDEEKTLRGRHVSGTSDSSSNYSVDRVPTPLDSPSRRRKRRVSRDSSASSRDGSPLLPRRQDGGGTGRRSSSRDHAKKTRCRCCVDSQQGRRRMSRGSGPSSS